jgi:hypothetical protein
MKVSWVYSSEVHELTGEVSGRMVQVRYTSDGWTDIGNITPLDDEAREFLDARRAALRLLRDAEWSWDATGNIKRA